ncbi:MAG: hypothetical protein UU24_C0008G0004 [Candidatus Nomurabacteria bacterium GW2011_GWA2_40_9]|uniref:Uncharacterized protein n=1 Tax=Candidatus Nomurabacteria bacterium GW2011_GWA2_40_9 TaxID=1618734 RepID=A0A0G0TX84_9BACT|nr:MAG: hypothetical protein UU24_C0008G0004 [Candidatus Nomurabacteria bacterium GW2011_GWA2_40_9]
MWKRIIFSVVMLLSVLFLPFWISVILGVLGIIYFSYFFEVVALFLLSDLLYGVGEMRYFQITFISSIISFLILIVIKFLKKKLKNPSESLKLSL